MVNKDVYNNNNNNIVTVLVSTLAET